MKYRYENIVHFRGTYTFQLLSNQTGLDGKARALLDEYGGVTYRSEIPILTLDSSLIEGLYEQGAVVPYSGLKRLAEDTGMEFDLKEPAGDEIIKASHLYLLSLMTDRSHVEVTINGKSYNQIKDTNIPYLGYLQESMSFYVVNDEEYEHLLPLGQELYTYNYQIADLERFEEAREALHTLTSNTEENYTARVAIDPDSSDIDWIKVLYSICIFMFLVFILASGSIMFMKVYNDAFEEKERYLILKKWDLKVRYCINLLHGKWVWLMEYHYCYEYLVLFFCTCAGTNDVYKSDVNSDWKRIDCIDYLCPLLLSVSFHVLEKYRNITMKIPYSSHEEHRFKRMTLNIF